MHDRPAVRQVRSGLAVRPHGARVSGVVASIFGAAGIAIVLFSVDNAMMFYVGVFLFGIGFAALTSRRLWPAASVRQKVLRQHLLDGGPPASTCSPVSRRSSTRRSSTSPDRSAGCFYLIIGFYVVTLIARS